MREHGATHFLDLVNAMKIAHSDVDPLMGKYSIFLHTQCDEIDMILCLSPRC